MRRLGIGITTVAVLLLIGGILVGFMKGYIPGRDIHVRGEVVRERLRCMVDGGCTITVKTGNREMEVVYARGFRVDWEPCLGKHSNSGGSRVGKTVEVYGELSSPNSISICSSKKFYIRAAEQ